MDDLRDILSGDAESMSEEELVKYLEGSLSNEERYLFEKKTADSAFVNDAIEGLQEFKSKQQLDQYVSQLNKNLHEQLSKRKQRKEKLMLKDNPWIVVTIIIILAVCVLGYFIIRMQNERKANPSAIEKQGISYVQKQFQY